MTQREWGLAASVVLLAATLLPVLARASDEASAEAPASVPATQAPETQDSATHAADVRQALETALDHGLTLSVADDMLTGSVGMLLRPRLSLSNHAAARVDLQMARPQLRVQAWGGRVKGFVQAELAGVARLLDAEVSVRFVPGFGVRVGRMVSAFSRTFYTPVPKLKFPEFSLSNTQLRLDRDLGVTVFGDLAAGRLSYEAGVLGATAYLPGPNDRGIVTGLARLAYALLGAPTVYDENACKHGDCALALSLGLNGYVRALELRAIEADPSLPVRVGDELQAAGGFDVALMVGGLQLQGEVYFRHRAIAGDTRNEAGAYAQLSYALVPRWLEPALRYDWFDTNLAGGADARHTLDVLLTTYPIGEHAKLWLQYSLRWAQAAARELTGAVGAGTTQHSATLMLQFFL